MKAHYAWLAIALIVGIGAFFAGRELRPAAEAAAFAQDLNAPVYTDPPEVAASSRGGFDGFGERGGLEGETIFGGEVVSISGSELTLRIAAGTDQIVRLNPGALVRRLEPMTGGLTLGASVIVRTPPGGDTALAVLIVSEP